MSTSRYQAILGMLHVSDQITEDTNAKLKKVDEFGHIETFQLMNF